MKKYDYIIVGQGIAGTCLSYRLLQRDKKVLVIDPGGHNATKVAAGNINPITGRSYVKSWIVDALLHEAKSLYYDLSKSLSVEILKDIPLYRILRSIKEENSWLARMQDEEYQEHISFKDSCTEVDPILHANEGYGLVKTAMKLDTKMLIDSYRKWLITKEILHETSFDYKKIEVQEQEVLYEHFSAQRIIFCEGSGVANNPFFKYVPIQPTKGEVLTIDFDASLNVNLRDKVFITPQQKGYWVGSGYEKKFCTEMPTAEGKAQLIKKLNDCLKVPYQIIDHAAGIRPCTDNRKPILGMHHEYSNVFIFNGMGTKGTSLAPYFSKMMCEYMLDDKSLNNEIDVARYADGSKKSHSEL